LEKEDGAMGNALRNLVAIALVGLACNSIGGNAAFGGTPKPGQKYALLIGINAYAPPMQSLAFCHNDMRQLKATLVAAGFPEDHVFLMLEGSEQSTCVPTKANIIRQIELRLALADQDDLVLMAFSGHGVLEGNTSYLCPCDCVLEKARETMVSMDEIYDRMKRCKAAQKILLVDACRKEPVSSLRAPGSQGFGGELKEPPQGLRVLASCDVGQWSAEDPKRRHGIFMYYVLEGLRGAADREYAGNRNGQVSLEELYE
jgi:uncharacterized caspase-like protein